ncbi:hypothetical protein Tco_0206032 [Tanacetum coccineum]
MSSSSSHATITYTSVSGDSDGPSFGILLVDVYGYESDASEAAPQSPEHAPLSLFLKSRSQSIEYASIKLEHSSQKQQYIQIRL